jgi:hypothetical protein
VSSSYDLLNIKADNGSLVLPQQTDYRLRQAFAAAGLDSAFEAINARRQRIQELRESSNFEVDSLLEIAVILYQHEELDGMTGYLELFKTEILDKELEIPAYQISRILGAAKVKAQTKVSATATDKEKQLIAEMSPRAAYQYSKLSLPERKACLEEHVSKGKVPSDRSVSAFKRRPTSVAKKVATPQPQRIEQPPLPLVDVVATPVVPVEPLNAGQYFLGLKRAYSGVSQDKDRFFWENLVPVMEQFLQQVKGDLRGGDCF